MFELKPIFLDSKQNNGKGQLIITLTKTTKVNRYTKVRIFYLFAGSFSVKEDKLRKTLKKKLLHPLSRLNFFPCL